MSDINEVNHEKSWESRGMSWDQLPEYLNEADEIDVISMLTQEMPNLADTQEKRLKIFEFACAVGRYVLENPNDYKGWLAGEIVAGMKIATARLIQMAVFEINEEQKETLR